MYRYEELQCPYTCQLYNLSPKEDGIDPDIDGIDYTSYHSHQAKAPSLEIIGVHYKMNANYRKAQSKAHAAAPFEFYGYGTGVEETDIEVQQDFILRAMNGRISPNWKVCEVKSNQAILWITFRNVNDAQCSITLRVKRNVNIDLTVRDTKGNTTEISRVHEYGGKRNYFHPHCFLQTGFKTTVTKRDANGKFVHEYCNYTAYGRKSFLGQLIFFLFKHRREKTVATVRYKATA